MEKKSYVFTYENLISRYPIRMAYLGGKAKGSDHIVHLLNQKKYDNMPYLEPFVGYGHILRRIQHKSTYIASDNNPLIIQLLKGIQKNTPYTYISKKEYDQLKNNKKSDFKKALAAFCYSYNGKEFGGYVTHNKERTRNYPKERIRYYEFLKKCSSFREARIRYCDYRKWNPKGFLIYCDPPYINTTEYGKHGKEDHFDHCKFWETIRKWSKCNVVYVSEYKAPSDFKIVATKSKRISLSGKGSTHTRHERVFQYNIKNKCD